MHRVFLLGLALLAAPAFAQTGTPGLSTSKPSNTTGFLLQSQFNGVSYGGDVFLDTPSGGGVGLGLGYGVSRVVTILLNYDVSSLDSNDFEIDVFGGTLDLGVRLNFMGERKQLVPYAEAALAGVVVLDEQENGISGGGLTVGGGVQYFVSEVFALRAGLDFTFGSYQNVIVDGETIEANNEVDFTNGRLHLGLSYYPMR